MSKKEESEFLALVDKFGEDIRKFFPEEKEHSKGLFLIAVDGDISEKSTELRGIVLGKKHDIVPGITKAMEENRAVLDVIKESSLFYDFKQDPKNALLKAIKQILED